MQAGNARANARAEQASSAAGRHVTLASHVGAMVPRARLRPQTVRSPSGRSVLSRSEQQSACRISKEDTRADRKDW